MLLRVLTLLGVLLAGASQADAAPRYWVSAAAADDSASCASITSATDPGVYRKTIAGGWACLSSGVEQTLTLKAGTYSYLSNSVGSWHNLTGKPGLDTAHPTTIEGFSGAGSAGCSIAVTCNTTIVKTDVGQSLADSNHVVVRYIKFDGSSEPQMNASQSLRFTGTSPDLQFYDNEVTGTPNQCVFTTANVTLHAFRNKVHDCAYDTQSGTTHAAVHGFYLTGVNNVIEYNQIYNIGNGLASSNSYAVQCDNSTAGQNATNCLVQFNLIHDTTHGVNFDGSNSTLYRNVMYQTVRAGRGVDTGFAGATPTGIRLINNYIYNYVIGVESGNSGQSETIVLWNNILLNNTTTLYPMPGSGSTITAGASNKMTGAVTDCGISTTDATQKASSPCIDAGTAVAGFTYNGSAPDQGPFESFVFASCVVENAAASKLSITFINNVAPPVLPASSPATFTARKATVADVVTASIVTGSNQVDLTLTTAIVGGDAVDWSWASGNFTDSTKIGYTLNQPFLPVTNQSCTNNVGGGGTYVFTQASFQFHYPLGTEAAPVMLPRGIAAATENVPIVLNAGAWVRLRMAITCTTADCPPIGFFLRYSRNSGAYTVVPDTISTDHIGFCGAAGSPSIPTNVTATTNQMAASGTFAAGAIIRTSDAIPTIDMALNGKTEQEYCVKFDSTTVTADTYDFRVYQADGTVLTYTNTARATVQGSMAGL